MSVPVAVPMPLILSGRRRPLVSADRPNGESEGREGGLPEHTCCQRHHCHGNANEAGGRISSANHCTFALRSAAGKGRVLPRGEGR
eukprot:1233429-Rhodomonas_salina.2